MTTIAAELVAQVTEQLRVFRDRDGIPLSEEQVLERARNIVTALLGCYDVHQFQGAK